MNPKSILLIYVKELRDILRDRRTVMSMIIFPLVLIPVLSLGMISFVQNRVQKLKRETTTIAWLAPTGLDSLKSRLEALPGTQLLAEVRDSALVLDLLREKDIDAAVIVESGFLRQLREAFNGDGGESPKTGIRVYADQSREKSGMTARRVSGVIRDYRSDLVQQVLAERGLPAEMVRPFDVVQVNIASAEKMGRSFAGRLLPYFIILMMLTGAMYPAVDLTAGEKERGTLETLLVSGVSRLDIVLGKFLTVLTASLVTGVLGLCSLVATGSGVLGVSEELAQELNFSVDPVGAGLLVVAMIPLGAIFSALLMTLGLFAKSFREAQSYISPLMIVVIIPAMMSMMPGMEFSGRLALIPVMNVSIMMREALQGTINPGLTAVTMGVNLLLAAICIYLMVGMFQREKVLFRI